MNETVIAILPVLYILMLFVQCAFCFIGAPI